MKNDGGMALSNSILERARFVGLGGTEFSPVSGWPGVYVGVATITPEIATALVGRKHPDQRSIKQSRLGRFQSSMDSGHWDLTHQGIALDQDLMVVDGQHRLTVWARADRAIKTLVFIGVPYGVRGAKIDRANARTAADENKWRTVHASLVACFWQILRGSKNSRVSAAHEDLLATYKANKNELDAALEILDMHEARALRLPREIAAMMALTMPIDRESTLAFGHQLVTGVGLEPRSPSLALRNWVIGQRNRGPSIVGISRQAAIGAAAQAIRAHLEERTLGAIKPHIADVHIKWVLDQRNACMRGVAAE